MRIRRIAIDMDALIDFGEGAEKVAEIWYDAGSTRKLRYSDWGPMVFSRLEPRRGALGWILDEMLVGAEFLFWTDSLPDEAPVILQAEDWLSRWLNRPGTPIHRVKGRLDFIEAQLYIAAEHKDLQALGIDPQRRQVAVESGEPWPSEWINQFMDTDVSPPTLGVTEPGTDDPAGEPMGEVPEGDGADEGDGDGAKNLRRPAKK